METPQCQPGRINRKGLAASIFITLLFAAFILFPNLRRFGSLRSSILGGIAVAFPAFVMFMLLYTGKTHCWRRIFFTTYAVAFAISFVWMTMGDRGHMWLLDQEVLYSEAPMCHMVVPMLALPIVFFKEIIFPVNFSGGMFMVLLVIVVGLIFGRAFCSWGCFYGGQDELFSSLRKKKTWNLGIEKLPPFIRYFSFAMLAFIILHSFATLSPTYCFWFCPFKATSEFIEVNSFIRVIQTFMFVGLWMGLAIVLPLLTKKRTQCSLFCPMGAFLSLTNKVNIFHLKIDKSKCSDCGLCVKTCPTFSLTKEAAAKGKPLITCTKCGACMDACPKNAIQYAVKGVPFTSGNHPMLEGRNKIGVWRKFASDVWDPGVVFVFGIFSVGTIIASGFFVDAVSRLLKLLLGV
ncbi:MAG: 4Fe-4S binding protein [Candidatus Aminicenantes bacterium]|nr:4Fe-4S binding protein [Candidatus Aminicenantes bacterium]NIM83350.1 4Fe-4S binding protein [Candidatus Aminicenantes bacterium]NIN22714.1 4Fe-4S binding protein [Candidatus Aminicenantes bacterium]NIN46474.1 4Fe-4S binding protein [Candidatus Aminicenantes bacterium]NIN89356.1 4Fe-4S binding protein [Candidatus Aminicenantes bacterium]